MATSNSTRLKALNKRAKQLVAANPRMTYKAAQKKAGAEMRAGKKVPKRKVAAVKKRVSGKTTVKRVAAPKKAVASVTGITAAQAKRIIVSKQKEQLASALMQREMATTKTAKKKAQKLVVARKAALRKMN